MRVWVTRTRPGAERTAERLKALGHEAVVTPVLEVRPLPGGVDLDGIVALAFTSANAVSAFARRETRRDLPVFAVGGATAAAARSVGFEAVRAGAGDVRALAALIDTERPAGGEVLHVAGRPMAGDLAGDLRAQGVPARTAVLYETAPAAFDPPPAVDAVLVHSPHAARVLAERLPPSWGGVRMLAISAAAAEPLRRKGCTAVETTSSPTDAALLALLAER